tara:strand:+ start:793 stop:1275 length:483 start_codon:yes stop_codon:yes gene_type:complete
MNKKDLIKALSGGLAFGLLVFVFIQIFLFFVDTEFETDEVLKPEMKVEVMVPEVHSLDEEGEPDVTAVTFKYEIRIQNSYDDTQLEVLPTIEDVLDYLNEYTRFHEDLYVYDLETKELILDSRTYGQVMQELMSKEDLLIKAADNPDKYTDEEIFQLLVD